MEIMKIPYKQDFIIILPSKFANVLINVMICQMYPEEYKDSKLHFYTTWTLDGYKSTGCFNLKCDGFILVNSGILTPGDVVEPEPKSGNWSVYREDLDNPQLIGYWPKSLFTALAEKATIVSWGGVVSYPQDGIGPPMGSGHYSSELQGKAAFVKNIEIFDSNGESIDLANIAKPDVNRGDCYNVTALVDSRKYGLHDGYLFYFGGPGGCSN
ncbi:hypothetical protein ACMD2_26828 [Ananas comosus]|uniref:Neprosin PEP catalytic domain-containing protein n=1 Tax=Ananas comosus TaxID=4615 RepID=A0A199VF49_ANACO|nr:hypothetical protein ACMD2_26828 [Ananas comosus]